MNSGHRARRNVARLVVAFALALEACATSTVPQVTPQTVAPPTADDRERAPVDPSVRSLPVTDVREDLALLRETLERVHPGYRRYATDADIDAAWARLDALVEGRDPEAPVELTRLYLGISRLLATIRCAHTLAELPPSLAEVRAHRASFLPFRFELVEGRMIVVSVDPRQPALAVGQEVTSIDGRAIAQIVDELTAYVSVDGRNDHVKPAKLADDDDLIGSGFEQFFPLQYGIVDRHTLHVREFGSGLTTRIHVDPIDQAAWTKLPAPAPGGARTRADEFEDAVALLRPEGHPATAVLRIDSFVNHRDPEAPFEVYGPIFEGLRRDGVEHLILDLRSNGGGSSDAAWGVADFLLAEPYTPMRPHRLKVDDFGDLRRKLQTRAPEIFDLTADDFEPVEDGMFELSPRAEDVRTRLRTPVAPELRFEGRLTVLTGPRQSSGVTNLITGLVTRRPEVRLVGTATGGSHEGATAGNVAFLELPRTRIKVRVPLLRETNTLVREDPRLVDGAGVRPDVVVAVSAGDVAAGRDPALMVALGEVGGSGP